MNITILSGHLTRDPEVRTFPSGGSVCEFSVADNYKWTDANGEAKEETTFVDCKGFNKTADSLAKHMHKGRKIAISGRLKQERWEDRTTGAKRSKIVVIVTSWEFADSRPSTGEHRPNPAPPPPRQTAAQPDLPTVDAEFVEDDVPF